MGEVKDIQAVDIGDIVHDLVWTAIIKLVTERLFSMIPFLAWGPLGILTSFVVGKLMEWAYEAMKLAVDLQVIRFNNEAHQRAFDTASVTLKIIARDKGINSLEFKEARDAHKKALAIFVKFSA